MFISLSNLIRIFHFLFYLSFNLVWSTETDSSEIKYSGKYFDLKEGIILSSSNLANENHSFAKYAYMADENFSFPKEFLKQTKNMIERESEFRNKCSIAIGTNIAQLCFYSISASTKDTVVTTPIEVFSVRACKGQFYLSGNDPVTLPQTQNRSSNEHSTTIDIQKISHNSGYVEVRQRSQPDLDSIISTLDFLISIDKYIENSKDTCDMLSAQAKGKKEQINNLIENRNILINTLKEEIENFSKISPVHFKIGTNDFVKGILQELLTCLQTNDFNFCGLKDTSSNKNYRDYIQTIKKKLSERDLSEILNSKYFNLGCSEPLLLFDSLHDDLSITSLMNIINKTTLEKEIIEEFIIQLHSTKTPCKSCLIGCSGHFHEENGSIKIFMNKVKDLLEKKCKKEVNVRFLISYHAPYEDDYPFYLPITTEYIPNSILLVNMDFYNEKRKTVKDRILKEYKSNLMNNLLAALNKNNGVLTKDDIGSIID